MINMADLSLTDLAMIDMADLAVINEAIRARVVIDVADQTKASMQ